jgi:hypothetical protein
MTDPHSPGRFRVNGTVRNMPEFQKAYSCKAGQPMVSANASLHVLQASGVKATERASAGKECRAH